MTLSNEIKEQLKQCEQLGVWEFCKTTPHLSLFVPAVDYDIVPLELWNGKISRTVQCLLVESLEQFAENKGYWFEFYLVINDGYKQGAAIVRPASKTMQTYAKGEAPTRLQAALDAFLSVDWSKDA